MRASTYVSAMCISCLLLALVSSPLHADGRYVRQAQDREPALLTAGREALRAADVKGPDDVFPRVARARPSGDGGGGSVEELEVLQIQFSDPANGNVVLLSWREETPNLSPILVTVLDENGDLAKEPLSWPGLPGTALPGFNLMPVVDVPEGMMTFTVEGDGDPLVAETTMRVLSEQPFADVENLRCYESEANGQGNCNMAIAWDAPLAIPSYHLVVIDSTPDDPLTGPDYVLQTGNGNVDQVNVGGVRGLEDLLSPGEYEITVFGFLETPEDDNNLYRGQPKRTTCNLECTGCNPPAELSVSQTLFSADGNVLRLEWVSLGSYDRVEILLDGEVRRTMPAPSSPFQIAWIGQDLPGITPGEHTVGIQAFCEGDRETDLVEATINVLDASPHSSPIDGELSCEFASPDETVISWTNDVPSDFLDAFVLVDTGQGGLTLDLRESLLGDRQEVTIPDTNPDMIVVIQFFKDGYGSDLFDCQTPPPGNTFVRGDCNGSGGTPQITTAVFGLDWLFGGGEDPPCAEACDTNADGEINLSDMVQILNFLFAGGSPPAGWPDAVNGACEIGTVDCETGLENCPF